jgi:hypothetical protein
LPERPVEEEAEAEAEAEADPRLLSMRDSMSNAAAIVKRSAAKRRIGSAGLQCFESRLERSGRLTTVKMIRRMTVWVLHRADLLVVFGALLVP